jgi:tetratricopeptide (TPR) repeat protein
VLKAINDLPSGHPRSGEMKSSCSSVIGLVMLCSAALSAAEPCPAGGKATLSAPAERRAGNLECEARLKAEARDYARAAELLLQAHALHPRPIYLFNAADSYFFAGRLPEAASLFRRYLETDQAQKDERPRRKAQHRIYAIGQELARRDQEAREQRDRLARERHRRGRQAMIWSVVTGAAATILAVSLGAGLGYAAPERFLVDP